MRTYFFLKINFLNIFRLASFKPRLAPATSNARCCTTLSHNLIFDCLTNKKKPYGQTDNSSPEKKGRLSKVASSKPDPVPRYTYMSNRAEWKLGILPLGIQPVGAGGILRPRLCCIQLGTKALCLQNMASRSAANKLGSCIHGALNHMDATSSGDSFAALATG